MGFEGLRGGFYAVPTVSTSTTCSEMPELVSESSAPSFRKTRTISDNGYRITYSSQGMYRAQAPALKGWFESDLVARGSEKNTARLWGTTRLCVAMRFIVPRKNGRLSGALNHSLPSIPLLNLPIRGQWRSIPPAVETA